MTTLTTPSPTDSRSKLNAPYDVDAIRQDFPALKRRIHGKGLVYLDNAATTLKPESVFSRIEKHYREEASNVHRGVHYMSAQATDAYEAARETVRAYINAAESREIIYTGGTTEAINLVVWSYGRKFLRAGDEVLISHMEHHSNIVPWQMLRDEKDIVLKVAPVTDRGEIDWEEFRKLVTPKTKLVSIVHVSNSLGTINPVEDIIAAAREVGAKVMLDGAQAVAHQAVDVQGLDCDFYAFSAHKLFGPTGLGVLYGKASLLENMPPIEGGGDMIETVTLEKTTFAGLPTRFEAGTPHIAGAIGLGAAMDYVSAIGLDRITAYEHELLQYGTERLEAIDGLSIIGTAREKSAVFSFTVGDIHPGDLGDILDREGVAVRTGFHCTEPLMQRFGLPGTTRASLALYNTCAEIDRLAEAIEKAKTFF